MSKTLYTVTVLATEKKEINVFADNKEEAMEVAKEYASKYGNIVATKVMKCERKDQ